MIPGYCPDRMLFTSETIPYFLSDEWKGSRQIIKEMFPGIKDYQIRTKVSKIYRMLVVMEKNEEVESIDDFVVGPGCISGKGWRLK